jgi:hypothetical protein
MKIAQTVHRCRWAEPTLHLAAPQWLDAWEFPWSCHSWGTVRPIADTRICVECGRWVPCDRNGSDDTAEGV